MYNEITKRILSSILLIPLSFFCIIKGSFFFNTFIIFIFIIASYEWYIMSKNKLYHIFGYLFLILSIYCCYLLRNIPEYNFQPFLVVAMICILTDVGGYIFGKTFKGPKLIKYSPNKTYSGLIGSFLLAIALTPLFISFFEIINEPKFLNLIFFVTIVSASSQFGDIIISYFKRSSNIKDSGKLIPGHGGILDRFDGMIFAYPISYLLIILNLFDIF